MKKRLFALFGILGLSLTGCGLPSIKQPTNQDQNTEQEQNQQQQEQPQEQEPVVVEHTVTFDTQGGSYLAPQKVKHGENAIRPADPTQDGYIFNDWVDENNDHWSFNGYTVTRDLTLYATWTANRHTVTFDTQGGSPVSSQTVLHGAFLKKPENPQKPGYAFVNWFGSNNNPWLFDTSIVTEDMTLYAVWDTILFNVTFESQGGTTVGGQQVAKGLYISRPADPQRQGYTFINWQDANGNVWNFDECPVTDNLVLYATWSINEYVVTFDAQGGEPIPPMTVGYNCTLSVPEIPSRDIGYGFVGWFRENGVEWDFSSDRVTENITLYAKWNLLPHTVRFYAEGATAPETQQVPHGGNATKPIDPIRPGYQLVDWVDQNGDHWSFNGYTVTKDLLLRAVWSARDYSVTFVNNDGTELDHQVLPCDSEITFQGETPIYANPDERYIYEFIGWDKPLVVPAENVVLTAQYQSTFISGKVSFYNYDESLLAEYNIVEGQPIPTYQGETPARASSGGLNYQFINWKETDDSSLTHVKYIAEYGTASNGLVFQNNSVVSYSGSTSEVVIPAKWNGYDITRIEPQAFRGNSFIQRITIPGTIKVIENWAFAECPLLSEVILEDGIETIYDHAFFECRLIESISIPNSVTNIAYSAFQNCFKLNDVHLPSSITRIEGETFASCTSLTEITIPDNVIAINERAFENCSTLTTVHVGKGLYNIAEGAFDNDLMLETFDVDAENQSLVFENGILFDSAKTNAIVAAKTLSGEVTLPSSLLVISKRAFFSCEKLTSVIIQDGVKTIDNLAFAYCSNLVSIRLPDTLTMIGKEALRNCPKLTSCYFPEGITNIPTHIFEGCEELEWVYFPSTLQSLSSEVFFYCWSVQKAFYNGTEEDWAKVSKHENESYCGNPTVYFYSETEPVESGNYWHFVSNIPTEW